MLHASNLCLCPFVQSRERCAGSIYLGSGMGLGDKKESPPIPFKVQSLKCYQQVAFKNA